MMVGRVLQWGWGMLGDQKINDASEMFYLHTENFGCLKAVWVY